MWLQVTPYLKVSKCLLNVRLFCLLLKCRISSGSHHHHIYGAIELLTFGMLQPSNCFVWRAPSRGASVSPGDCHPFPQCSSPHACPRAEPSSPVSHSPSCWVAALSASGEKGEPERVQSHLLFYRQPAFSPRDLIITQPVERITHEALSHTMIDTCKQDCMLPDTYAGMTFLCSLSVHSKSTQPPYVIHIETNEKTGTWCKGKVMLQCSTWSTQTISDTFQYSLLVSCCTTEFCRSGIKPCLHTDTKGEQTRPSKSKRQQWGARLDCPLAQRHFLMRQTRLICVTLLILSSITGHGVPCKTAFARETERRAVRREFPVSYNLGLIILYWLW